MVLGFNESDDFSPVVGWELYEVKINKYHVMFYFQDGWKLLNVAHSFSHRSADGTIDYTFEIYGPRQTLQILRLIYQTVVRVDVRARDRLALVFDNGDELIIHDDPETRSWWFTRVLDPDDPTVVLWDMSDVEPEDIE